MGDPDGCRWQSAVSDGAFRPRAERQTSLASTWHPPRMAAVRSKPGNIGATYFDAAKPAQYPSEYESPIKRDGLRILAQCRISCELIDGRSRVWCSLRGLVSSLPGAIYRKLTLAIPSSMEHFSLIEQTGGEWIASPLWASVLVITLSATGSRIWRLVDQLRCRWRLLPHAG